jgi:glycosyltransferase involved in cell wall biosynthesis
MDIVLDNIIFSLQSARGISTYWKYIVRSCFESKNKISTIDFYRHLKTQKGILRSANTTVQSDHLLGLLRYMPIAYKHEVRHIFHSSYYRRSLNCSAIQITTVHDFVYEKENRGLKKTIHHLQKKAAILASSAVICVSENTQRDLKEFVPEFRGITKVIYHGVSSSYEPDESVRQKYSSERRILFVGKRSGYKNFDKVVQSFRHLKGFKLIVVGGGNLAKAEIEMLNRNVGVGCYNHVIAATEKEMKFLYNSSSCLVYPSECEGFGLPILEAMSCGCPVVCSSKSSIPEVAGKVGIYLGDTTPEEIAAKIEVADSKKVNVFQSELIKQAKTFTWERSMKQTLALYEDSMNGQR